jgi:hypothetical protein
VIRASWVQATPGFAWLFFPAFRLGVLDRALFNFMRYLIAISLSLTILVPLVSHAKRAQAAKVVPVVYGGVRYTAPNDDGRRGYIQAWRTETKKLLWEVTVFRNSINPALEEDVQWVFIKKLRIVDGTLMVLDERGRAYRVDAKTHTVKRVKAASSDKTQANPPARMDGGFRLPSEFGRAWPIATQRDWFYGKG